MNVKELLASGVSEESKVRNRQEGSLVTHSLGYLLSRQKYRLSI